MLRYLVTVLALVWTSCALYAQSAAESQAAAILKTLDERGTVTLARVGVEVRVFDRELEGRRIEALRFATVLDGERGGVLLVPGFGRGARDYLPLGVRCAAAGFVCVAVSQPGFGGSQGEPDFAGPDTVAALAVMLQALREESDVDPARIGAFGYSRGALAVASLAAEDPLLAAVVLGGGIYDFSSAYESIELAGIRAKMESEAGLDPDAVAARSPLQRASRMRAPTLILHGEDDQNAPVAQAHALHQALQDAGTPIELQVFPQHGHALPMGELAARMTAFLGRYLAPRERLMAISIDDLPVADARHLDADAYGDILRRLIDTLREREVPAIGFVNEGKLAAGGRFRPERLELLEAWLDAGLELGNHSHSHPSLNRTPVDVWLEDVARGERFLRPLLAGRGTTLRYFRHPYLHTGRDIETRSAAEARLGDLGLRVAPVTIDNADYLFAAAYASALQTGDAALAARLADQYIAYMLAVVRFYEQQSIALVGRNVPHVLLLHANALNAAHLGRLLDALGDHGYAFANLDRVLEDPVYARDDQYFGPAGISWLHRWALTEGRRGDFFRGEPEVPEWVNQADR